MAEHPHPPSQQDGWQLVPTVETQVAPVGKRVAAAVIDYFIRIALGGVALLPLLVVVADGLIADTDSVPGWATVWAIGTGIVSVVVFFGYETLLLSRPRRTTFGQQALNLTVSTRTGAQLDTGRALLRSIVEWWPVIFSVPYLALFPSLFGEEPRDVAPAVIALLLYWAVLAAWIAAQLVVVNIDRPLHRAIHDRAAGTLVHEQRSTYQWQPVEASG